MHPEGYEFRAPGLTFTSARLRAVVTHSLNLLMRQSRRVESTLEQPAANAYHARADQVNADVFADRFARSSDVLASLLARLNAGEDFTTDPDQRKRSASSRPTLRADTVAPKITGYAARFYNGTPATEFELGAGIVERIMPGAFDRALREGHDVRGLFNHDADHVLGRTSSGTMRLSVDAVGLKYQIQPSPTSAIAKEVIGFLKRGDVSGSSFAFVITTETWREEGRTIVREVQDLTLYDCGPVTYPAYESTSAGVTAPADRSRTVSSMAAAKAKARAAEVMAQV